MRALQTAGALGWTRWAAVLGDFRIAMTEFDQLETPDHREPVREGVFDDQLSFPTPFMAPPQAIQTIVKRDGREVPFNQTKIAQAILRAAQSIGGHDADRARDLAAAVTIYLVKKVNGAPPTVDQVHDAVEKVLIEMGHTRTAVAYVRYRDRRGRIRRFRDGDTTALWRELDEARMNLDLRPERGASTRMVRTSRETLAAWDRERIVAALVRETGLDEITAGLIALEVEQQIESAHLETLTAPLVREMVTAKLLEHGLEDHGHRHRRLGVPLYDAEQIICGPHMGPVAVDPVATDLILAESVKREFALGHVFSPLVADAHRRGDIHIHDLGFIDRLHTTSLSLEYVKRFGIGFFGSRGVSRPPKYPDTLLAQMLHFSAALQSYFAGPIVWEAVNVFFAPFVSDLDEAGLRQLAQMIIFEFAHRAAAHGERVPPAEVVICWDVPAILKDIEAVGPGGEYTGRRYGEYALTARQFAWAFLDVFREGGVGGISFAAPLPLIRISPEFFGAPGHEAFLNHVADVAVRRGNLHVLFDRHRFECIESPEVWQPLHTAAQCVTMNLPRAAYRAENEAMLMAELERVVEVVVQAHDEKRAFVERLMAAKSVGPLALLSVKRDGHPFFELDHMAWLVTVTGLNECVQAMTGTEVHASDDALAVGCRIVQRLGAILARHAETRDLDLVLGQDNDRTVSRRLAALDAREFHARTAQVLKNDESSQSLLYTPGAALASDYDCSPIERVRKEGVFHPWLRAGARTRVCVSDGETARESIAGFITKAFHQTETLRLAFVESGHGGEGTPWATGDDLYW